MRNYLESEPKKQWEIYMRDFAYSAGDFLKTSNLKKQKEHRSMNK